MESSIDLFLGNSVEENSLNVALMKKNIRDHSNPLELPNKKFISYFRLNKDAFVYVLNEIKDHLKQPQRSSAIPPILFMAEGTYQKCSGNNFNLGLAQPTVSVGFKKVLDVVEERICIKTRFPGVIGCIDGTHVRIIAPKNGGLDGGPMLIS